MQTNILELFSAKQWDAGFSAETAARAVNALEQGKILFFPELPFTLLPTEKRFLSSSYVNPKTKNISFHAGQDALNGARCEQVEHIELKKMLKRFALDTDFLVNTLLAPYAPFLQKGRTSFRPVEIKGRPASIRKDDTRLHVDAFPSQPIQGRRILRVFTNINPNGVDRVWRVGEPFAEVAKRFLPKVRRPFPLAAPVLRLLGMTKCYRTEYDHLMLQIHNTMKGDEVYQRDVPQAEIRFSPGNTWIVLTDSVSHAAMTGQHLLEQTFYLPVSAMADPEASPLRILESLQGKALV